jgi:hypothetical protein
MNPIAPSPERLWTMRRNGRSFSAEISSGQRGWELRFVTDGKWFASDVLESRERAIRSAREMHANLAAIGWVDETSA